MTEYQGRRITKATKIKSALTVHFPKFHEYSHFAYKLFSVADEQKFDFSLRLLLFYYFVVDKYNTSSFILAYHSLKGEGKLFTWRLSSTFAERNATAYYSHDSCSRAMIKSLSNCDMTWPDPVLVIPVAEPGVWRVWRGVRGPSILPYLPERNWIWDRRISNCPLSWGILACTIQSLLSRSSITFSSQRHYKEYNQQHQQHLKVGQKFETACVLSNHPSNSSSTPWLYLCKFGRITRLTFSRSGEEHTQTLLSKSSYPLPSLSKTRNASLSSSSLSVSFIFFAIMFKNSSKSIVPLPSHICVNASIVYCLKATKLVRGWQHCYF